MARALVSVLDLGFELGTAPPPVTVYIILGVLLRAIYNHVIIIIQLFLRWGSTQGLKCWDSGSWVSGLRVSDLGFWF